MPLSIGIIGLPNVGKSTLLNALTRAGAAASNYPFCTIDPNVGEVAVPDERLEALRAVLHPATCTPQSARFVDIAGLVRGSHKGEGLGNQFLAHIRDVDAVLHVVRCFAEPDVSHVEGGLDPARDLELVETELALADLETARRALEKTRRAAKAEPKAVAERLAAGERVVGVLERGAVVRDAGLDEPARTFCAAEKLLTAKPSLVVANVSEDDPRGEGPLPSALRRQVGADRLVAVSARIEEELAELEAGERADFLRDLGLPEGGLVRLIRAAHRLLGLITFYTHAHDKLQAWPLQAGATAAQAAGRIHSNMETGFIRADVVEAETLIALGSRAEAQKQGKVRSEGRDYRVRDGDVLQIQFRAPGERG